MLSYPSLKRFHVYKNFLEVEELLKELEDAGLSATKAKDIEGLLTHYHPDAVVIHKGVKAYYGQNGWISG